MFKRTCAFVAISVLSIASPGAAPAFAAKRSGPVDPAGTYSEHGTLERCVLTITDEAGITQGHWADSCTDSGSWTVTGKTIVLAANLGCDPIFFVGTLSRRGISSAKKPGSIIEDASCGGPVTLPFWATK
jgi:hypothetical protein